MNVTTTTLLIPKTKPASIYTMTSSQLKASRGWRSTHLACQKHPTRRRKHLEGRRQNKVDGRCESHLTRTEALQEPRSRARSQESRHGEERRPQREPFRGNVEGFADRIESTEFDEKSGLQSVVSSAMTKRCKRNPYHSPTTTVGDQQSYYALATSHRIRSHLMLIIALSSPVANL